MKIYLVGGAVRDKLLSLPIKERDWVVVGATAQTLLDLGYRQVGKEFPVFLHPQTHEEYALARMERKVELGYKGFTFDTSPDVTLEADLLRRDLTINAMAETADGELVDPYHGKHDLENRLLRHVSPAFAEDPVRILRIGRFLARYAYLGFQVAPETLHLMREMVAAGEVDALVPERVWKELERALSEKNPEQFFLVLDACGALPRLFPGLTVTSLGMQALIAAAQTPTPATIRFAALLHDVPAPADLCQRYRLPNAYRELVTLTAKFYATALQASHSADTLLALFQRFDIYRREQRFQHFVTVCQLIAKARNIAFDADWLRQAAHVAKSIPAQPLLAQGITGQALAIKLREKRKAALESWLEGLL